MEVDKLFLIVEDDSKIRSFIRFSLKTQEYRSIEASNGKEALNAIVTDHPDIMILDLGLPDMDGLSIIQNVRTFSDMPIIVVSARDQDREKVEALDAGADDYLTKPFNINELLARIRVILRHFQNHTENPVSQQVYHIGNLEVDLEKHQVLLDRQEIHFTPMEFKILALMIRNSGKVLTHSYILKNVWGDYLESDTQSLRVFMANIRRKLEKDPARPRYIFTEVGIGYRFANE
ncbi:MAG: response regulator transcription factor [Oscillospiraceae bacterium]|nr:response regulator transcription factor [Oscillospiraceae bacterium]